MRSKTRLTIDDDHSASYFGEAFDGTGVFIFDEYMRLFGSLTGIGEIMIPKHATESCMEMTRKKDIRLGCFLVAFWKWV